MAFEVGIGAEGAEDVLGAADEQTSQVGIAGFGDAQLFVERSGLVALGHEPEVGGDIARSFETLWIFDGEYESQCGDGADSRDLAQALGDGVFFFAKSFDGAIELANFLGHDVDDLQGRFDHGEEFAVIVSEQGATAFGEAGAVGRWQ